EQEAFDHISRQRATVHVNKGSRATTALMDVLSQELLARAGCSHDQDGEPGTRIPLRQSDRSADRRRHPDDHGPTSLGNRGDVTLSASASVLRIVGVRNRYSSVSDVLRSVLPNRPPRSGMCDSTGMPDWFAFCCRSRRPPNTIVCPSFTSTWVAASRVEMTGASNKTSVVAALTSCWIK